MTKILKRRHALSWRVLSALVALLLVPTAAVSHHDNQPHSNWDGLATTGTFTPVFDAVSHPLVDQQSDLTIRFEQNPDEDAVSKYEALIPAGYRFAIGSIDPAVYTSCSDFTPPFTPASASVINSRTEAVGVAKLGVSTTSTNHATVYMAGQSYFLNYSATTRTATFCALVGTSATTAIPSPNNQALFEWTMTFNPDESWTISFDLKSVFGNGTYSIIDNPFYQQQDVTVRNVSIELRGLTYGNYNMDEGTSSSVVKRVKNLTTPDLDYRTSTRASIGEILEYQLVFENAGSEPAHAVTVVDALPAHLAYQPSSCAGGTSCQLSPDGTEVEWALGDVPAHATRTLGFRGTVTNTFDAAIPSMKSRATGSTTEETPFVSNEIVVGNKGVTRPLSSIITGVHKIDLDPEGYYPGSNTVDPTAVSENRILEYRTTYTNNGNAPATHVVVANPIPSHTKYQLGTCQPAASTIPNGMSCGVSADSKRIEWRLDQVPAGQTRFLTFRAQVDSGFDDNAGIRTIAFGSTDQESEFESNEINVATLAHRKVAFAFTPTVPGQYVFSATATPCGYDATANDPVLCASGAARAEFERVVGISKMLSGYHPIPEIQTPAQLISFRGISFAKPILGSTSVDVAWIPPQSGPVESQIKGYLVTTGVPYQSDLIHFDYLISNPNAPGYDSARDPCAPNGTAPECSFKVQFPLTTTNGNTLGPNGLYSTSVVAIYMDGHRSDGRCDNGTGPGTQPPCQDGSTPTFFYPGFTARQYIIRARNWPLAYAATPTGRLYLVFVDLDNHEAEFVDWIPYGVSYPMQASTIAGSNTAAAGLVAFVDNTNTSGKRVGLVALATPARLQGYFIRFVGPSGLPDPGSSNGAPVEIAASRL